MKFTHFMKKKKYEYVCYQTTVYTLLLYLMHSTTEQIRKTLFLIPPGFPEGITDNIPSKIFVKDIIEPHNKLQRFLYKRWWLSWLYLWPCRWIIFKNVKRGAKIFAQDHLYHSNIIIGWKKYTFIEDGPGLFSRLKPDIPKGYIYEHYWKFKNNWRFPLQKLLLGPTIYGAFAQNDRCSELLLSIEDNAKSMPDVPQKICNIYKEWDIFEAEKKELIKSIYNITTKDIELLNSCTCILYTQNYYWYGAVTQEEQIEIFKKIIAKYPNETIVIKPHPADSIRYEDYIPNILTYRKNVPSQLLTLVGIRFKRLITTFSTAVFDIPYETEIDWYGTEVDTKLFHYFGHQVVPKNVRVNYCKL